MPGTGVGAALAKTILVEAAVVGLAFVYAVRRRPRGLVGMGFERRGSLSAAVAGGLDYLILFPVLFGIMCLWPVLAAQLGIELEEQPILRALRTLEGTELLGAALLATCVIPFLEEAAFRGFLQPVLVRELGVLLGVVGTSVAFALLHPAAAFGPVFALSLLLGWLRVGTGRLAAPCVAHGLHNGLVLAMAVAAG